MELEEAIKTALQYETRIHSLYAEAEGKATDAAAKRIFGALAKEESQHVGYLRRCLREWLQSQRVLVEDLVSAVPAKEVIQEGLAELRGKLQPRSSGFAVELDMLHQALAVEIETTGFYRRMVEELPEGQRELFARFLEVEDGHRALVQAQIDSILSLGTWYDHTEHLPPG
jgi:rubrerythrin